MEDKEAASSVIDVFSTREACTVLAAMRVFQQVRAAGGKIPSDIAHRAEPHHFTAVGTIGELEHFEDATQLSDSEIDALADRIAINWRDVVADPNP
jgi:hypothetical protein